MDFAVSANKKATRKAWLIQLILCEVSELVVCPGVNGQLPTVRATNSIASPSTETKSTFGPNTPVFGKLVLITALPANDNIVDTAAESEIDVAAHIGTGFLGIEVIVIVRSNGNHTKVSGKNRASGTDIVAERTTDTVLTLTAHMALGPELDGNPYIGASFGESNFYSRTGRHPGLAAAGERLSSHKEEHGKNKSKDRCFSHNDKILTQNYLPIRKMSTLFNNTLLINRSFPEKYRKTLIAVIREKRPT